ncbi:MAG: 3-hydroxybutyryl-CoA dehydrogenase [Rhodobacterales bacterium 17-64-5]|nr:MAG: 3-hydroxybutyryl-CoA dehydrogenase [Rhodobacterales bacterium 17-64-5]
MIIGVVGLGTMGLGIAQVYAAAGFQVLATDAFAPARDSAPARLRAALEPRVAKGALTAEALKATMANLTVVESPAALAPATLIVEAILETLEAKQDLFAALEAVIDPETVLATNTSSLSVAAIAQGLTRPARVLGLHFFNPAPVMKLVELVAHPGTSAAALSRARSVTEAAGKTVIACPDRPGFIVNRCARPFYGEALALLEEGRTASDIDAAMLAAGYRIGPLSLIDLIGADINLAATEGLQAALRHPRYHVFDSLKCQVAAGRLGRKSGQGFLFPAPPGPSPPDAAALALRIEATLANEARWLLAEGGVTAPGIDQALKLGLNFPRGPFESAASHGAETIGKTLADLESRAPAHLKGRYQPPT